MFKRIFIIIIIISLQSVSAVENTKKSRKDDVNSKNKNANASSKNRLVVDEEKLPLKLHNLIDLTLERNSETRQAYLNTKMAEEQLIIAKSDYYPKLSIGASTSYNNRNDKKSDEKDNETSDSSEGKRAASGSLNISYNLFAFGKYRANVRSVQHYLNKMKYQESDTIQDIIHKVVDNYYNLLSLEAQKEASIETENLSLEAYKSASLKYNLGLVPLVDKLKSNNSYSESRLNRIKVENEIKKQRAVLNNILNLEPNYTLYLEIPNINVKRTNRSVNYFIDEALANRIDLKMLKEEKKSKAEELKNLNATKYPEIKLNGSVSTGKSGIGTATGYAYNESTVSLSVNIPLFNGFGDGAIIRAKEKELKYIDIKIKQLENDISNEVWAVYHDFDTHQRLFLIAKNLLETASENAKVTLGMYKNGKASMLDVLDSQSQLEKSKFEFINSKYNWLIYRMKMLRVIGKMNLDNIINIDKL
jgi:outer membrane protein